MDIRGVQKFAQYSNILSTAALWRVLMLIFMNMVLDLSIWCKLLPIKVCLIKQKHFWYDNVWFVDVQMLWDFLDTLYIYPLIWSKAYLLGKNQWGMHCFCNKLSLFLKSLRDILLNLNFCKFFICLTSYFYTTKQDWI